MVSTIFDNNLVIRIGLVDCRLDGIAIGDKVFAALRVCGNRADSVDHSQVDSDQEKRESAEGSHSVWTLTG